MSVRQHHHINGVRQSASRGGGGGGSGGTATARNGLILPPPVHCGVGTASLAVASAAAAPSSDVVVIEELKTPPSGIEDVRPFDLAAVNAVLICMARLHDDQRDPVWEQSVALVGDLYHVRSFGYRCDITPEELVHVRNSHPNCSKVVVNLAAQPRASEQTGALVAYVKSESLVRMEMQPSGASGNGNAAAAAAAATTQSLSVSLSGSTTTTTSSTVGGATMETCGFGMPNDENDPVMASMHRTKRRRDSDGETTTHYAQEQDSETVPATTTTTTSMQTSGSFFSFLRSLSPI